MTTIPPMPHATYPDETRLSIQLFTIEETGLGPYVGLPVTSLWLDDTPHLFTRETAEQIARDVTRDDLCMSYAFSADGTLTLQWTDDYDALGRVIIVVPDVHGRYLIGGMWPWAVWGADDAPHTAGQAAFALGAAEYRWTAEKCTEHPEDLEHLYVRGREEAHRVSLGRDQPRTTVPFDIDPVRTPLIVRSRPVSRFYRPLPPGALESAIRPVAAGAVGPGDLVVGGFTPPHPDIVRRRSQWFGDAYVAAPALWDAACECTSCETIRAHCGPAPAVGRLVMKKEIDGECVVWDGDDIALIIPASLLPAPA